MDNVIKVNVNINGNMQKNEASNIYAAREITTQVSASAMETTSEATIIVQAYNQLEKTKRCVESVLKYTQDVDYDLILIDNGSEPDVLEYFKSIDYPKTTIIHVTQNIGVAFPFQIISMNMLSEYVVTLANDMIVTKNWLSNMLKVFAADEKVGVVNPVGCNVSNFQQVELNYTSYEEMQEKAALFNVSDSTKWQERLRIITLGTVYRKSCLYAIGWPLADVGFIHDFVDDDLAFRVRRMGYKVVVAGDTWVCHDHKKEEKDPVALRKSLDQGRADFQQKYHGIDAWDDVNNYIFYKFGDKIKNIGGDEAKILGIDVKCGSPILDIKNCIRKYGIYDTELSAFTRDEKYVEDLKTICNGTVVCDREEFITRKLLYAYYDYIIIDKEINSYYEPINVLMDAYMLLNEGGQLIFSLKNTYSVLALQRILGNYMEPEQEYYYNYPVDALFHDLHEMNMKFEVLSVDQLYGVSKTVISASKELVKTYCHTQMTDEMCSRLVIDKVWISLEK